MTFESRLRTVRILWFALFSTTVLFFAMGFLLPPASPKPEPIMLPIFGFVALTSAVMSVVLPRKFQDQAFRTRKVEIVEAADPTAASDVIPGGEGPKRRVFKDRNAAIGAAFPVYQAPFILGMALCESVALFGFALGHLGFGVLERLPFFVVAWIGMLPRFPTLEKIIAGMERAHGAVMPPG
jgi:hypothetical protein